jgi:DNA-binding transcriptional regulator GbsR (MarR family)
MRKFWEIRRRQSAADAFREIAKELEELMKTQEKKTHENPPPL